MSAIGEDEELDPATLATEELRRRRDPLVVLGLERRWGFQSFFILLNCKRNCERYENLLRKWNCALASLSPMGFRSFLSV